MRRLVHDLFDDIMTNARIAADVAAKASREKFASDVHTQYIICHALQIVGEASNKVPLDVRARFDDLPWDGMVKLRHVIVHDYFEVNAERIFEIARYESAEVAAKIAPHVQALREEED